MANNIAMGFQGIQLPDPLNAYAKVMSIQNAQNQNALAQYQMASAQRADADQNKLRETLAGFKPGMKFEDQYNALISTGNLDAARKFAESHAKASKDQREGEKASLEVQKLKRDDTAQRLRNLATSPTDDRIDAHWNEVSSSPLYSESEKQALGAQMQQFKAMPVEQRMTVLGSMGATAADLKPQNYVQNLGGTSRITRVGPDGRATVAPGSEGAVTSTPHQAAMEGIARQRAENSAAQPASEDDAGTVDFLAESLRQTGVLPSMGRGANADRLRSLALKRVAQLGKDEGKTAATTAGDVRTAKADTAGATSTIKDFSSGMSARRVTANNTAINHLATMEKLATDLSNTDVRVFNAAANMFAKATGATAPTSFDAARQLVASEVIKAVVNNGGGVTERQEAEEQFSRANGPEQLKGVINTYKELLAGQLDSLGKQYEVGSGRKDFDKRLTPETRKVFEKVRGTAAPAATKAGATVSNW